MRLSELRVTTWLHVTAAPNAAFTAIVAWSLINRASICRGLHPQRLDLSAIRNSLLITTSSFTGTWGANSEQYLLSDMRHNVHCLYSYAGEV